MSDDTTRMNPDTDETRMAPASSQLQSGSGWLSSGSVDHGRFAPGTMLDNRYRVLGLLGRGGMGEVYRADDLRLGQQVALKFLPEALAVDARRLAQFHNEVRTARQVSHPNVCRVYDIGEINGQLFLTMEYVDGEDLSVLLRRIGRLPEERAIEIARQICAGLAAAHERGILHRDLKPANIMLDGAGKVRIMDFSLAAIGHVEDVRAGTPAYMAPEQLSGLEVTVRSDIYALGLVLYEIFTGRRAFDVKTIADLVAQHQSGSITSPSQLVSSLDDAVDRAIMRCLDPEPSKRPSSALGVAASLPGGDPLAAALAAGETPSPEMVAAAGGQTASISVVAGALWMTAIVVLLTACVWISDRSSLFARVPLTKSLDVLADRADELRQSFGYTDTPADHFEIFATNNDYLKWAEANLPPADQASYLAAGRPAALEFWRRTSPTILVPRSPLSEISLTDPPPIIGGMTTVILDSKGRLLRFEGAPPQKEAEATSPAPAYDWNTMFAAAGLDRATFADAPPSRTPAVFAADRRAWKGTLTGTTVPVQVEGASYRGRPVLFEVVGPWTPAPRDSKAVVRTNSGNPFFIAALLVGAIVAARANLRSGRADRRGAFRIAAFIFSVILAAYLVDMHVGDSSSEQQRFFAVTGIALFLGAILYLIYLGLEPFVRRSSPLALVGWSRVLAGRFRDPLVGRDLLIGVACGVVLALGNLLPFILPQWVGLPEPSPILTVNDVLQGMRGVLSVVVLGFNNALQAALITVFEWVTFRFVTEWLWAHGPRRWRPSLPGATETGLLILALVLTTAVAGASGATPKEHVLNAIYELATTGLTLILILRVGLLGAVVGFLVANYASNTALTFDSTRLYAPASMVMILCVLGLGAAGFWLARSGDAVLNRFDRMRSRGFAGQ